MKHVIIGVGAAGITAAKTIRANQPDAEILMVSLDEYVHSRCMLHKYISKERTEQTLCFVEEDFFDKNQIEWINGHAITKIFPEEQTILVDEMRIAYDKLLLATGANSVIPPVGDLRVAQNVFGLRHLSDVQGMEQCLLEQGNSNAHIVIIGSGLVGLDAAYGYLERGMQVSIVEMADHILPMQLDQIAALAYQKAFEEHGCQFYLDKKASRTILNDKNQITSVILDDNTELPCDMVIVAAGVRPAIEYLEGSGITYERGVCVDSAMQTNIPSIYAAGDVTGLSGIWPNAMKQGEVAGMNMCGITSAYTDTYCIKNTINFFHLVTLSIGSIVPEEEDIVIIKECYNSYKKVIIRENCVIGVILQGDISGSGIWQYLIKNKIDVSKFKNNIFDVTFAEFYNINDNGEYFYAASNS